MFIILLSLIFIRPFISSSAFPYLNLIYSSLFLGFLIPWMIIKKISFKKIQSLKYPLILLCLALIISVVFSQSRLSSVKDLHKYIIALLLFIITISLSLKDKLQLLRIITWGGIIIGLLAIYQYFFGFQHLLDYIAKEKINNSFALDYIERKRIFFPFVTPNALAGYLAMIIPLSLINKRRIWFIIPLSFALFLTKSLGAFLSIFLALIIYFYLQDKLGKRKILLLLFGLLIIIGLIFITRTIIQKQHTQPIFSVVMRLNYWKDTLEIIKARPLTGVGIGNFNLPQCRYAHNSYLQIWAEMGTLGLISFLWLVIVSIKSNIKNIKRSNRKKEVIPLITASFVFLIHNLMDFTFFLPEVSLIWWIILGATFY